MTKLTHALATAAILYATFTSVALAGEPRKLTWKKDASSVTLLNDGKVVWRHEHSRATGKPTMRIGLLDGTELTRPWPFPKGYPKSDHVWHKGLWWSWKAINGINFWEKNQKGTDPNDVSVVCNDDGSARIEMTVSYHLPDAPPLAVERRVVEVSAPDAAGGYLIRWRATFTPGRCDKVVFNRNGYGGLAIRFAGEFAGDPDKDPNAWRFVLSPETAGDDGKKKPAGNRWVAYAGTAQNGRATCVAMFDHPDNPRYPTRWALRTQYPYLNPCFIANGDFVLNAGQALTLQYGIWIHPGSADATAIEKAWKTYAGKE
jgi:hypothetical protein